MPRYDLAGNPIEDDPPPNSGPYGQQNSQPFAQPGQPPVYGQAPGSFGLSSPPPPQQYGSPPVFGGQQSFGGQQPPYGGAPGYGQPSWPPPPANAPPSGYSFNPYASNSSGTQSDVPVEIDQLKWNWGAFLLCRYWLRNHGMRMFTRILWISLAAIILLGHALGGGVESGVWGLYIVINCGIAVYFGLNGNRIAWRNRSFDSIQQFYSVQRAWMIGGFVVWAIAGLLGGIFVLSAATTARTLSTMPRSSSSYGNGYGNGNGGYGYGHHHGYGTGGYGSQANTGSGANSGSSDGSGSSDTSDDTDASGTGTAGN